MSVKIKFCGMTDPEQVAYACDLGVDAIGMILYADSPRTISLIEAANIRRRVPASVSLVGVFVNASKEFIESAIEQCELDLVQLHGEELNDFGAGLSAPFIKAIRAKSRAQVQSAVQNYPQACAVLLDPYVKGVHGGTGQILDQNLWPTDTKQKLILAGGLSPDNLAQRLDAIQPWAVDINSGIEDQPGQKSSLLMQQSVAIVRDHLEHAQ